MRSLLCKHRGAQQKKSTQRWDLVLVILQIRHCYESSLRRAENLTTASAFACSTIHAKEARVLELSGSSSPSLAQALSRLAKKRKLLQCTVSVGLRGYLLLWIEEMFSENLELVAVSLLLSPH